MQKFNKYVYYCRLCFPGSAAGQAAYIIIDFIVIQLYNCAPIPETIRYSCYDGYAQNHYLLATYCLCVERSSTVPF